MSGYFGVGVQQSSKTMNAGNLLRTTHAFGGSFFFFVQPDIDTKTLRQSDTSKATQSMPIYEFASEQELRLPKECQLVGVELTDDAIELPSFRHPKAAAYILGPERGSLSPYIQKQCDFIVKIPAKFCVNVGVAGAVILYDRMICRGKFKDRPVHVGGPDWSIVSKSK